MMLLAYRLVRDQGRILKACRYLVKNANAEHGQACKPQRARPEGRIYCVAKFIKDLAINFTLRLVTTPFRSRRNIINLIRGTLDTGATGVVVPAAVAGKLGIKKGERITVHTANGKIEAYAVRLDSISIGDIRLTDVKAMINPNERSEVVLLGMSFLKHIEFTQRGDTLILRQGINNF